MSPNKELHLWSEVEGGMEAAFPCKLPWERCLSKEGGEEKRDYMVGREQELNLSSAWYRGAWLGSISRRQPSWSCGDQQHQPSDNSASSVSLRKLGKKKILIQKL